MGKTSQKTAEVELPPEIKAAALDNLKLAKQVGRLPYVPNFGAQFAAFTPMQENAFGNTNAAARAFGLPSGGGTGMPKPMNVGGISGYSTQKPYEDSMSRMDPATKALYEQFFFPNKGGGRGGAQEAPASGGRSNSNVGFTGSSGGKAGKGNPTYQGT